MPDISFYEKRLQDLIKKQEGLKAEAKQVKAKMSSAKKAAEKQQKIILGWSILKTFRDGQLFENKKDCEAFERACRKVFKENKDELAQMIELEYQNELEINRQKEIQAQQEKAQAQNDTDETKGAYYANQTHNQF